MGQLSAPQWREGPERFSLTFIAACNVLCARLMLTKTLQKFTKKLR